MRENLKLVSTRLDPKILAKIDDFVSDHYYWKRNSVINGVLTAVFNHFTKDEIYDMCRTWDERNEMVDCKYKLNPDRPIPDDPI